MDNVSGYVQGEEMKTDRPNPKVGQVLYSVPCGNRARCGATAKPVTVKSVGRKYFTVGLPNNELPHMHNQVYLGTWQHKSDTCASFDLFESEVEWQNQLEANKLRNSVRDFLAVNGDTDIPVWKLRQVAQLLGIIK